MDHKSLPAVYMKSVEISYDGLPFLSALRPINAVAQFERDLLIERTQSGLQRAKAQGKALGRPPVLSAIQKKKAREQLTAGHSISAIARDLKTSRQTIMRIRDQSTA